MLILTRNSPNQSARIHGADQVNIIVIHTPEGSYRSAINTCMSPSADVSYHMLIKRDGTEATQLVPWSRKAWHAKAYNSISDGISLEGYASLFNLNDHGTKMLAFVTAQRLISRGLPCQWTTDPMKGGFCRHADLQSDRSDPTPDIVEWKLFCAMVKAEYDRLKAPAKPDWPIPVPDWFWTWARWRLGVGEFKTYGPANNAFRPGLPVPPPGPSWAPGGKHYWAWRRLKALQDAQKA